MLRKILLMAKRDYIESVRTKAFIIGLVVAPLLFGGGFLGIAIMKKKPDLRDKRIAVLDRTGLVAPALVRAAAEKNAKDAYDKVTHAQTAALYVLEAVTPSPGDAEEQRLALSESRAQPRTVRLSGDLAGSAPPGTGDEASGRRAWPTTPTRAASIPRATGCANRSTARCAASN